MKSFFSRTAIIGALMSITLASCSQSPKYVFYMIGDGMGINEVIGTQIYNEAAGAGSNTINFLNFPVRTFVTTYCANTLVTDSAAAGTALASGSKANYTAMGVDPEGNPLENVAERAVAAGFGAGVATSVGVNHATPAAFYSHTANRNNYSEITAQLIASKLDFAAGGGINTEFRGEKTSADFVEEARAAGIEVYVGKGSFDEINTTNRVICLEVSDETKGEKELKYSINQTESDVKLLDFTKAAIKHLYNNHKDGFFLMIEGGMIDHACHDDDGATTFQEVNDFVENIDAVLEFYKQHPKETLIIVTADHETGGLMLGSGKYEMKPKNLTYQKMSEGELSKVIRGMQNSETVPTWEDIKAVLSDATGMWSNVEVDEATETEFLAMYNETFKTKKAGDVRSLYSSNSKIASAAIDYINKVAGYTWSFGAHSGSPVGLYAIGAGSEAFASCKDNTDIPRTIIEVAGY